MAKKEPVTHVLIPKHTKLSEKEKQELFEKYNISIRELPKIYLSDAALIGMDVKENDVIKIERKGATAGQTIFYRGVIDA